MSVVHHPVHEQSTSFLSAAAQSDTDPVHSYMMNEKHVFVSRRCITDASPPRNQRYKPARAHPYPHSGNKSGLALLFQKYSTVCPSSPSTRTSTGTA
jgi:hypothetical protein